MTILHVTDFHFNKRWFDWLLHHAPAHDLVVMSGDMLDLSVATPHRRQIEWVSDWLNDFPRPISVCSGNHDLEWDCAAERWTPAYWLREIVNPHVWTDGQRVELDGLSVLNIGATTRPKGGAADIWVVHAPPSKTLVATRSNGADAGDVDLVSAIHRHAPRVVLSGHVHAPLHWREHRGRTLFLNPGHNPGAAFPNHILVRTDPLSSYFITAPREDSRDSERPLAGGLGAESAAAAPAVA
jgi:Icc-related predicted phosphoesterase